MQYYLYHYNSEGLAKILFEEKETIDEDEVLHFIKHVLKDTSAVALSVLDESTIYILRKDKNNPDVLNNFNNNTIKIL